MTTRDAFLDLLAPTAPVSDVDVRRVAREIINQRRGLGTPVSPVLDNPVSGALGNYRAAPSTPSPEAPKVRPDYADAIDALVADMVAAGDVVFDASADQYRAPRWRRYRFGGVL